jgi:hypothetical protein
MPRTWGTRARRSEPGCRGKQQPGRAHEREVRGRAPGELRQVSSLSQRRQLEAARGVQWQPGRRVVRRAGDRMAGGANISVSAPYTKTVTTPTNVDGNKQHPGGDLSRSLHRPRLLHDRHPVLRARLRVAYLRGRGMPRSASGATATTGRGGGCLHDGHLLRPVPGLRQHLAACRDAARRGRPRGDAGPGNGRGHLRERSARQPLPERRLRQTHGGGGGRRSHQPHRTGRRAPPPGAAAREAAVRGRGPVDRQRVGRAGHRELSGARGGARRGEGVHVRPRRLGPPAALERGKPGEEVVVAGFSQGALDSRLALAFWEDGSYAPERRSPSRISPTPGGLRRCRST